MSHDETPLDVDPAADDSDPCYTDSERTEFSTQSLTSSIYEHRYENGRRYHAYQEGKYLLPNDEREQDRLDIVHHIYCLLNKNKLHHSPIGTNPQNILDVGTGTGIWAIDVAEFYPSAHVIGTDLSPIQPSWVPPNVSFQIDDAELEWTFKKNHFDLIHIRNLAGGVKNWKHIIDSAFRHCRPGGWIEVCEYEMALTSDDGSLKPSMPLYQFYGMVAKASIQTGRDFRIATELTPVLEKAGFTDIEHLVMKVPIGTWPADKHLKEVGAYVLLTAQTGYEAYGLKVFTGVLGMSEKEAKEFLAQVVAQAGSRKIHGYTNHHCYYAQKPMEGC